MVLAGGADRGAGGPVPGRPPRAGADDYVALGTTVARSCCTSTPAFWVALLLIDVLSVRTHVFPAEAPQGSFSAIFSDPGAMVLPVLTVTLVTIAAFSRYIRSSVLDELAQDYVRMARSKGTSRPAILLRHRAAQRPCLPVITLLRDSRCRSSCRAR